MVEITAPGHEYLIKNTSWNTIKQSKKKNLLAEIEGSIYAGIEFN